MVNQPADALDMDTNNVARFQRKFDRRDDAGAGHQLSAVGKGVVAAQI